MNNVCNTSRLWVKLRQDSTQLELAEVLDILKRSSIADRKLCDVSKSEFVEAFSDAYEGSTVTVQELPQSLFPMYDCHAEQVCAVTDSSGLRMRIPDRFYERGWNKRDSAFYFPLASEYNRLTLRALLRVLCNREQDYDRLCIENKFRSGCLLMVQDGFTVEQLEQFRKAARVVLYGIGRHPDALQYPLDDVGSAVAVYINHTAVLRRVLSFYRDVSEAETDSITSEKVASSFDFVQVDAFKLREQPSLCNLFSARVLYIPVLPEGGACL